MTKVLSGLLLAGLLLCLGGCGGQSGGEFTLYAYTRSDACGAAETWALYLGDYHQEDLKGTAVYGDPGLAEAVKKDPLGIGYNNLNYAYDMDTEQPIAGLRVVPIDLNDDGQIDASEDFYATKGELMQAIATGQYPSPPARDLYFVTKDMFTGIAKEFVRWVLTEGQQYVVEVGYVALSSEKVAEQLEKLGDTESEGELEGTITVSGAWALYPMTIRWAEVFRGLHPDVKINIAAGGAGLGMVQALKKEVDIGMVSREIYPSEIEAGAFWVAVTKDCVVPVVNEHNPVLEDLMTKGVKRQTLSDIWVTGTITDWRDVVS